MTSLADQAPASAPHHDPSEFDLTRLWDALLRCQVDMTLPVELPHYFLSPAWRRAATVIDLGTGNGYYLHRLRTFFPAKTYRGVDIDASLIELARHAFGQDNLCFDLQDIFAEPGTADAVIARLVAQHMHDLPGFVKLVARVVLPGGIFISIEPADTLRHFIPPCPLIERMYRDFIALQTRAGLNRQAGCAMSDMAPAFGLRQVAADQVAIPSTLPGNRNLFVEFHRLIFELFERRYDVPFDREATVAELGRWQQASSSYAQVGIHMSVYQRVV